MTAFTTDAILRPLRPRDPAEHHRAATPLELLYDLVLVIAIAAAAASLHHAINENHVTAGVLGFAFVFWALWWPWVNFTWFASAYDNDDLLYRILVFIQMIGALMLAVGIKDLADQHLTVLPLAGYIVMRVGMISLWLRAAWTNPAGRSCAQRYALGIGLCQVAWVLVFVFSPPGSFMLFSLPVMIAEMAVPAIAEANAPTPWHRHHIIERYGLLTIIVFGESLLAAASAISAIAKDATWDFEVWSTLASSFLILFTMWWIYFGERQHAAFRTQRGTFLWGYVHYFIFASAAAVGAGITVAVDHATHHSEISAGLAASAVAIPVAVYLVSVWFAHDRTADLALMQRMQLPLFAALVLLTPWVGHGVLLTGLLLVVCLAIRIHGGASA